MVRQIFRGLLLMVALVLVVWLMRDVIDQAWIDTYIRNAGVFGMLRFVLVCCLLGSVGMSRQLVAFLGGYAFGFYTGLLLSMLAVVSACITTYLVARVLLQSWLSGKLPHRIRKIDRFLHDNTFIMALLLRLLPLGSNWLINITAGVSSVKMVPFLLGSMLGYIPQMVIFSLLGSGARVSQFWQVAVAMALFVLAAALGFVLYKKVVSDRISAQDSATHESGVTANAHTATPK